VDRLHAFIPALAPADVDVEEAVGERDQVVVVLLEGLVVVAARRAQGVEQVATQRGAPFLQRRVDRLAAALAEVTPSASRSEAFSAGRSEEMNSPGSTSIDRSVTGARAAMGGRSRARARP